METNDGTTESGSCEAERTQVFIMSKGQGGSRGWDSTVEKVNKQIGSDSGVLNR